MARRCDNCEHGAWINNGESCKTCVAWGNWEPRVSFVPRLKDDTPVAIAKRERQCVHCVHRNVETTGDLDNVCRRCLLTVTRANLFELDLDLIKTEDLT